MKHSRKKPLVAAHLSCKNHEKLSSFIFLTVLSLLCLLALTGCISAGSFKPVTHYELTSVSHKQLATTPSQKTLLISMPVATTIYQTSDMIYQNSYYQPSSFSRNSWDSPPAQMLHPLIVESLQNTGYFYAVVPAPTFAQTNWRLDTQLLKLQQDFTKKPSQVEMVLNVTLIDNRLFKVIASRRFSANIPTLQNTPYGGVVAANAASQQIMEEMAVWAVRESAKYAAKSN